jgi:phage-related tail fiber protein
VNTINKITVSGNTYKIVDTWRPVSDSTSSNDSSTAASSKAVKTAYDLAASKTSNTGTVTKVSAGTGLTGGDITTTGTISLATSGVTAGTYKRVTVDAYGRVTSGDNTDTDTNTARL